MRLGLSQRHLSRRGVELVRDSESGNCRFGQDPQPCMRKKLSRQQARCFLPITSRGLPAAAPSAASGDQPQRPRHAQAGRRPGGARGPDSKGRFQSFVCRPVPGRSLRAWRERPKLAGAQAARAASLASTVRTWRLSAGPDGSGHRDWQVLLPGLVPLTQDKGRGHSIGAYGDKTPGWAERAARGEL
jgi:hypothetical protein